MTVGSTAIGSGVTMVDTEALTTQSTEDVTSRIPNNNGNVESGHVVINTNSVGESIHHSGGDACAPNVSKDTTATQKKLCKQVSIQVTPQCVVRS